MITRNQFEEIYPLVNEIVAFSDSFANEDNSLFRYFKTMGKVYGSNDLMKIIRSNLLADLLHCYFTLGYQQNYNSNCYVLFDLLQYAFWFDTNHFSYEDFVKYTSSQSNASYFLKGFNNAKRDKNSGMFPALCIDLIKVDQLKCVEYLSILKEIAIMLFKNTDEKTEQNEELINALLTDIESFSVSSDYINESQHIEDNREIQHVEEESNGYNTDNNFLNMNLLKNKLFNGVSFEILKEEYREGYSNPFTLQLRISNFNDKKKKIGVKMKYISIEYGLKDGSLWDFGNNERFLEDNSFVDVDVSFADIRKAKDGDRIEMLVNEGKFATLRLIREKGQWSIVESIERNTYSRQLKSKIEHFEAIEEQFGITLQNFSVKVEDENSLDLYCEVLALDGKVEKSDFTIEAAIYDSENEIVYHTSLSSSDFKGFEVYHFGKIYLDITVDEISKIRIYPIR